MTVNQSAAPGRQGLTTNPEFLSQHKRQKLHMARIIAHLELNTKDWRNGIHTFTDVRASDGWGDVLVIGDHRDFDGRLNSVTNYRNMRHVNEEIERLKKYGAKKAKKVKSL